MTVEADNAAASKARDVRTTGGDASLSSTPTDIAERLRAWAGNDPDGVLEREAADEIERLMTARQLMQLDAEKYRNESRAKSAEIERLRAVTHGLMKILARPWIDGGVTWPEWDAAMKAAEDALGIKAADMGEP